MRILFINNDGAGFADHVELAAGLNIAQLFCERLPQEKTEDYLIRVNRQLTAGIMCYSRGTAS